MLILNKPYISEFLQNTAEEMRLPALDHGQVLDSTRKKHLYLLTEEEFLSMAGTQSPLKLYCNSENSIGWIAKNLSHTTIPGQIDFCKNKVKFRRMIQPLYPKFFFREIDCKDIGRLDVSVLKKPFIIKPSVGFFSIGVYKVNRDEEWEAISAHLLEDIQSAQGLYPDEVMNSSKFILEECIDGEEFAIDAYYNSSGKPVILNILKHLFSSDSDVSDRVYYTSKEIILEHLEPFGKMLEQIGAVAGFSNFPVHAEVRIDRDGTVTPIEFNPMRFAGWCVTDIAHFAYKINPYEAFFFDKEPDWDRALQGKDGKVYSMVLVDMPKGFDGEQIERFDYQALCANFRNVLELRKIDFHTYPVFAFLFLETSVDSDELEAALKMDFAKFISEKPAP